MSFGQRKSSSTVPQAIPQSPRVDDDSDSRSRAASTARLASPVPSSTMGPGPQIPTPPAEFQSGSHTPLAGPVSSSPGRGPGRSALAAALEGNYGRSPPKHGTPHRIISPGLPPQTSTRGRDRQSSEASKDRRESNASKAPEDFEVVSRHLVQHTGESPRRETSSIPRGRKSSIDAGPDLDEFSSLQLKGGDVTRGIYKWAAQAQNDAQMQRSKSFSVHRAEPDAASLRLPGAMRREFLQRGQSPAMSTVESNTEPGTPLHPPRTSNFLQFLTLYGHFAGENLEDIDEEDEEAIEDEDEESQAYTERTPLVRRLTMRRRTTLRQGRPEGKSGSIRALVLLLKSFVGTGILFLPRAFANGGMLFGILVLLGVAALSYYCFILLINTRSKIDASFGDMGGILFGKWLRGLILGSLVLSQIGFVSAYIVFTAENLKAFAFAISDCVANIDIKLLILAQLTVFLPMSLFRDINKLGGTAFVAEAFILIGILYLAGFDISVMVKQGGIAPSVVLFNPSTWSLFIGTAVFTFEGIGLILPIQDGMRRPQDFPRVLFIVMIITAVLFTGMGALSYATFGAATKTVVLLNLPQDYKFVNAVQFLYAIAILLSTPLQLFPAIRILENAFFTKSGRRNKLVKWYKNFFRFFLVFVCALIAWVGAGDLDKFVSLVGSFACIPLVYIYPVSSPNPRKLYTLTLPASFALQSCSY